MMNKNINQAYVSGRISVIIPCYHAGKYMEQIYENLRNQTFTNFEAILVNDGDESQIEQMHSIASKDKRIKVVWKEKWRCFFCQKHRNKHDTIRMDCFC